MWSQQGFELLAQHLEKLSRYSEVLFQRIEVLYYPCILRHCSNTLRYYPNTIVPVFWVPYQYLRYRLSIPVTVSATEVLSQQFLEKLNKASKFSVRFESAIFPDTSQVSYALKLYVRCEIYHRYMTALFEYMNVVNTCTVKLVILFGWALVYIIAVTAAK
jgi:hypothetical protein